MLKVGLLMFLGILVRSNLIGQTLQGTVTDMETGENLPYAHIYVKGLSIGEVGLKDGSFSIDLSKMNPNDTLIVRMIGYQTNYSLIKELDLNEQLHVQMRPIPFELSSVTVESYRDDLMIGSRRKSNSYTGWGDFESARGRARGLVLEEIPCPSRVKSIGFRLKHNDWDSVAFRLNLLTVSERRPDSSVLRKDIILVAAGSNTWFEYSMESYNLMLCNQILVVLEWVDAWGKTGAHSNLLTFAFRNEDGLVYYREKDEMVGRVEEQKDVPAMYMEVFN